MDESTSDCDISMSPTQILEKLQVLRQLQLVQRGKLQQQRLEYKQVLEHSPGVSELLAQLSNSTSTSYNTFKSLLQVSRSPNGRCDSNASPKVVDKDFIEGVSELNLSRESEYILTSPGTTTDRSSVSQNVQKGVSQTTSTSSLAAKKQIVLDDIPILTVKKDFQSLLLEKVNNDKPKTTNVKLNKVANEIAIEKKPFLKRGEGMSRFGLKKNNLVIQNTNSLPWKKRYGNYIPGVKTKPVKEVEHKDCQDKVQVKFTIPDITISESSTNNENVSKERVEPTKQLPPQSQPDISEHSPTNLLSHQHGCQYNDEDIVIRKPNKQKNSVKKHPLITNKGKTWAAILTNEQGNFLRQLKQSDYYKNFTSPAKSTVSDMSCDENLNNIRINREVAEQNMFELLEKKVNQDNFNLENSFFNKFLRKSQLENSGESTPLVFQKCLSKNPGLLHIYPPPLEKSKCNGTQSDMECDSECTDCDHETCSSVSTCCSCNTVEENKDTPKFKGTKDNQNKLSTKEVVNVESKKTKSKDDKLNDTVTDKEELKSNMVDMNAKLVATSELLKDRLRELEDEIETFRKENANLSKMREDIDSERQRFYEEKSIFEQKLNEEKILSEYYLAEEKEKLSKQKQMYERYVREIRGRLNKKDKEEVVTLKREINDLKEEIRNKDAKQTTTIARLRNQIKIMEKDKKDLEEQCEKLRKENKRMQHSNQTTRRLTNIKYLEEVNRKLNSYAMKDSKSDIDYDSDVKYKSYEIERIRNHKKPLQGQYPLRKRAKSVPNLNVTSRYAKYFSQRDAVSEMEKYGIQNVDRSDVRTQVESNQSNKYRNSDSSIDSDESIREAEVSDNDEQNQLEKMYTERFRSKSPESNSVHSNSNSEIRLSKSRHNSMENADPFFIRKINSNNSSRSSFTQKQNESYETSRSKSPSLILSSKSTVKSPVIFEANVNKKPDNSPEMNKQKTNLNPTEIKRPDGTKEFRFPNGNIKYMSADGKYTKFTYYNGDTKETFSDEGRIKYYYAETKTHHTTFPDGLEVLEFPE